MKQTLMTLAIVFAATAAYSLPSRDVQPGTSVPTTEEVVESTEVLVVPQNHIRR